MALEVKKSAMKCTPHLNRFNLILRNFISLEEDPVEFLNLSNNVFSQGRNNDRSGLVNLSHFREMKMMDGH
jgi:hypothetical protein